MLVCRYSWAARSRRERIEPCDLELDDLDDALTYTANPRCHRIFARQVLEAGLSGDDSCARHDHEHFSQRRYGRFQTVACEFTGDCDSSHTIPNGFIMDSFPAVSWYRTILAGNGALVVSRIKYSSTHSLTQLPIAARIGPFLPSALK